MQLFVSEYNFQGFFPVMQRVSQSSDLCEATATALRGVFWCVF